MLQPRNQVTDLDGTKRLEVEHPRARSNVVAILIGMTFGEREKVRLPCEPEHYGNPQIGQAKGEVAKLPRQRAVPKDVFELIKKDQQRPKRLRKRSSAQRLDARRDACVRRGSIGRLRRLALCAMFNAFRTDAVTKIG